MSMIIKGREIVLNDHAQITAKIRNENKTVDVFWYLEKVDQNVYPYDDNHAIDYILCVYSHIVDYTTGSLYPMDKMYFFMIHNSEYRVYREPEDIKTTLYLKNINTNDIIYETSVNYSTRYSGNYTFNRIAKLDKPIYEKFNGIPEDKYQEIMDILGKDRCNSICIDTVMIQTDIGDGDNPLPNTCYLYDNHKQITCRLIYSDNDITLKPVFNVFNGSVDVATRIKPIDIEVFVGIANEVNPIDMDSDDVYIAALTNPADIDGSIYPKAIFKTNINGSVDISIITNPIYMNGSLDILVIVTPSDINGTVDIAKNIDNPINIDGTVDISIITNPTDIDGSLDNIIPITRTDINGTIDIAHITNPTDMDVFVSIANEVNAIDIDGTIDNIIPIAASNINGTIDIAHITNPTDVDGTSNIIVNITPIDIDGTVEITLGESSMEEGE